MCYYYYFVVLIFVLFYRRDIKETLVMILSPLSNSELSYNPTRWNKKDDNIQKYNNCYAYATNDLRKDRTRKPHPGNLSGTETNEKDYLCPTMNKYLLEDHPGAYKVDFNEPCKCNYFKAHLVVDPKTDFHLYRQDSNGYWSHKPGSRKVTNTDASGNYIMNPEMADREYKKFNYTDSCMFFCMPHNEQNKKSC
jgi:hypothetical protein